MSGDIIEAMLQEGGLWYDKPNLVKALTEGWREVIVLYMAWQQAQLIKLFLASLDLCV